MAEGYFEGNSKDDALDFYCVKCGKSLQLGKTNKPNHTKKSDDDNEKSEPKKDGEKAKNKKVKTDDVSKEIATEDLKGIDEAVGSGGEIVEGDGGGGGGEGGGGEADVGERERIRQFCVSAWGNAGKSKCR